MLKVQTTHEYPLPSPDDPARNEGGKRTDSSCLRYLSQEVDTKFAYVQLLVCYMISGMLDSVSFNAAGVFVSMQTGNTIFLALGAADLPGDHERLWLKAFVSILSFQLGCFVFSRMWYIGIPQKRALVFVSSFIQLLFLLTAAALAQTKVFPAFGDSKLNPTVAIEDDPVRYRQANNFTVLLPVSILAFQFGGQVVMSRVLGYSDIPTNVLSTLYCDLVSDRKLFSSLNTNAKRNRRIGAAVCSITGGIAGGWLQRSTGGMSAVLWLSAFFKLCIAVSWLLWPTKAHTTTERWERVDEY